MLKNYKLSKSSRSFQDIDIFRQQLVSPIKNHTRSSFMYIYYVLRQRSVIFPLTSRNIYTIIFYLDLTIMTSHCGQSVQKKPNMLSDSGLHLWVKVSPLSLCQNCTSSEDRRIATNFPSSEYLIDKMGPSLTESFTGATLGSNGTVFHEKTYIVRERVSRLFSIQVL